MSGDSCLEKHMEEVPILPPDLCCRKMRAPAGDLWEHVGFVSWAITAVLSMASFTAKARHPAAPGSRAVSGVGMRDGLS